MQNIVVALDVVADFPATLFLCDKSSRRATNALYSTQEMTLKSNSYQDKFITTPEAHLIQRSHNNTRTPSSTGCQPAMSITRLNLTKARLNVSA